MDTLSTFVQNAASNSQAQTLATLFQGLMLIAGAILAFMSKKR